MLSLSHLVCDFNGSLAVDGVLLPGVAERITKLSDVLSVHVVTADTFGQAQIELGGLPLEVLVLPPDRQTERKIDYLQALGTDAVVAIGNGNNDAAMLEAAALGICVVQSEGASVERHGGGHRLCIYRRRARYAYPPDAAGCHAAELTKHSHDVTPA